MMQRAGKNIYQFGPFHLDAAGRRLLKEGRPIALVPKVFDILLILVERKGALVTKEELRRHIWAEQHVGENNLTVRMSALRKALGEQRGEHLYIETVPGEGYRFVAEVREVGAAVTEATISERRGISSLAVLPLVNESSDENLEYLAEGITESIISSLSQLTQLRVMARNTVFRFKGAGNDPLEAGQKMGVDAVMAGRVVRLGGELLVGVELADVRDQTQVWGKTYRQPFSDILEMQERLASDISEKLSLRLTKEEKRLLIKSPTENTEAYRLYLKGRYFWNKRTAKGIKRAIQYFEDAIRLDEFYALAYIGLSDCYEGLTVWNLLPRSEIDALARGYVTKAIEIDGSLAEAYAALATIELHNWNWAAAERNLKFALKLNPNYADAHYRYSVYLTAMGRFDEAIAAAKLAQVTDPFWLVVGTQLGAIYQLLGQYEQAVECCDEVIEMDQSFARAYGIKGVIYARTGRCESAIQLLEKTNDLLGGDSEALALLGYAYGVWGKRRKALAVLRELQRQAKQQYVAPFLLAYVYAGLGEVDKAFQWLEKAYQERSYSLMNLKVDPIYEHMRSDERFTDLLRRLGLTH